MLKRDWPTGRFLEPQPFKFFPVALKKFPNAN